MCCTVDAVLLHAHTAISSNNGEEAPGMYQHLQCTASTAMAMEYILTSPPIISIPGSKASFYVVVLLGCVCLSVCLSLCMCGCGSAYFSKFPDNLAWSQIKCVIYSPAASGQAALTPHTYAHMHAPRLAGVVAVLVAGAS